MQDEEWNQYREEVDRSQGAHMTVADVADVKERLAAASS